MSKIIVFDLDDTLIKEIDFLKSAFLGIASSLEEESESLYKKMLNWYYNKENVFQNLVNVYPGLCLDSINQMYRTHQPNLEQYSYVKVFLNKLKVLGYNLGLITDGFSITQRNKIKALGIEDLFDLIIISEEFGSEKPSLENYTAFHKFNSDAYFYVGDNLKKDFFTPNKLGWTTICLLDDGYNIHSQDFSLQSDFLPKFKINTLHNLEKCLNS